MKKNSASKDENSKSAKNSQEEKKLIEFLNGKFAEHNRIARHYRKKRR